MNRNRKISSWFAPVSNSNQPPPEPQQNEPHVDLNPDDIEPDPGLRKPIEELHPDVRDAARRECLAMGRCKPTCHNYLRTPFGNQMRSFREEWFDKHDWLEYSVDKEAAFCFYCFLFKQPRAENFGIEAYTKNGFKNWKNAITSFDSHVGDVGSAHNKARRDCRAFQNPRQNVQQVWAGSDKKKEEEYLGRLTIMLSVVRFLLLQALAFRGHDESAISKNRGNFLEMVH